MRRMSLDADEFDPPGSEQFLELAISLSRRHRDLGLFLEECGASGVPGLAHEVGPGRWEKVWGHLRQFAGLELPDFDDRRRVILLSDDWDDLELAIGTDAASIWYHWYTTA